MIGGVDDFRYTYAGTDGAFGEFVLAHEDAVKLFPHYSTMEIVQPPMIALDKQAALAAKKAQQALGLSVRRQQVSEVKPEGQLDANNGESAKRPAKPKVRRKLV